MSLLMLICYNLHMIPCWSKKFLGQTYGPSKPCLEDLSWCQVFEWIYPKVLYLGLIFIPTSCKLSLLSRLVDLVWFPLSFWAFPLVLILAGRNLGCRLSPKLEGGWRCGITDSCRLEVGWCFWIMFYPIFPYFSFLFIRLLRWLLNIL